VCSSVGRPARTPSIATGMKEEQQIRVMAEFGVERIRRRVESDRTWVGEFLVCFDWVGCPQSIMAPYIYRVGRSCPSRTRQIYLWKFKSDQICLYRSDRGKSVHKSGNFQIP
jgi:hypothetical protein